jgi:hypothetical protein
MLLLLLTPGQGRGRRKGPSSGICGSGTSAGSGGIRSGESLRLNGQKYVFNYKFRVLN